MELKIPQITSEEDPKKLDLRNGDRLFIVGPNGSGKSALINKFFNDNRSEKVRLISAHRQTWISSMAANFTSGQRQRFEEQYHHYSSLSIARMMDDHGDEHVSAVLFDLIESEVARSLKITNLLDDGENQLAREILNSQKSNFSRINELLKRSTFTFTLQKLNGRRILAQHQNGELCSIAQLSDGERNAILIAAEVLTVKPGTLVLIDEPERHVHRSIIEPFLSAVFKHRDDCPFVIATHEIALPNANSEASVLILRSCKWQGDKAKAWEFQMLKPEVSISEEQKVPEDIKLAILGSRKQILFVEGEPNSLDKSLYNLLFPYLAVKSRGSTEEVKRAVKGLRATGAHHYVEGFGLIDRDDLSDEEVEQYRKEGIFALEVHSVESLYYGTHAIASVAKTQARIRDHDADEMQQQAIACALNELRNDKKKAREMAARLCHRKVRDNILSQLGGWEELLNDELKIQVAQTTSLLDNEIARFNELVDSDSWDKLVARYPLHKSGAFSKIRRELKCSQDYEQIVLANVRKSEALANQLRDQIGSLSKMLQNKNYCV